MTRHKEQDLNDSLLPPRLCVPIPKPSTAKVEHFNDGELLYWWPYRCVGLEMFWLWLEFLLFRLLSSLPLPEPGLDPNAVPSLVILVLFCFPLSRFIFSLLIQGTAKGGTTDIWHMIHKLPLGFHFQTSNKSLSSIQLKKELNFWSGGVCAESFSNSNEQLRICSANEMKVLLNCPRILLDQHSLQGKDLIRACQRWLQDRQLGNHSIRHNPSPPSP
jgi:hypothetical protein